MCSNSFIRHPWFTPLALALLAVLAYANSFPGAFILDDLHIARNNPLFAEFDFITLLRSDYWYGIENSGLYRPLTILSLYLNRLLLGDGPLGFHLVNVLLHAGVTVLLWRVLLRWGFPAVGAFVAGVIFALHPIHSEVVDVVVGRSELLAALLLLTALLIARQAEGVRVLAVCGCFLLAMFSKENAIVLLALLPLLDAFVAGSWRVWLRRWPLYLALVVTAAAWLLWREVGLINPLPRSRVTEAANPLAYVDGATRVLSALQLQGMYLIRMLLGIGLQAVYAPTDLPEMVNSATSLRGFAVIAALAAGGVLCTLGWRRRHPLALFALLYLVSFLPTANIVMPIGIAFAERLAYLPSIWYCAAIGVGSARVLETWRYNRFALAAIYGYALWLGGTTLQRNLDFVSEYALWSAEVRNNPEDYLAWQNLAEIHASAGRLQDADSAFRRMLELAPDYPGGLRSRTYFLLKHDRYEEALEPVTRAYALARAKDDPVDISFDGLDAAEVHLGLGNFETALRYVEGTSMLQLRAHYRFLELRGKALANLGRDKEAVEDFARVTADLHGSDIRYYHGQSLFRLGRVAEARQQLERAVRVKSDAPTWNLLGVACATLHDRPAAAQAFAQAVALAPENGDYRDNLVKARREAGM